MDAAETAPKAQRKVYRGKLTSYQVILACVLGAMLGFVPGFVYLEDIVGGFEQAPGLILSLLALALVLRCSLVLFVVTAAVAKLLSFPLEAVSFEAGRFLVDGPTSGLFETMINAPVLAWFGFQYYLTSGGLLIGFGFGILWFFLTRMLLRRSATEEDGSRWHLPVRLSGVIALVVLVGTAWALQSLASSQWFKDQMRDGLQEGNGATVDIAGLDLDLAAGKLTINGLEMADPNQLQQNLFDAQKLEIKLGTSALLSRRVEIESISSDAAATGSKRKAPGKRIHPGQIPEPPKPKEGEKTLEDYITDYKVWEQRLYQANEWLETLFPPSSDESEEDRDKRIDNDIETKGRAMIAASHLIKGSPLLLVRKVDIQNVAIVSGGDGDSMTITASNLSTNPSLVDEPASLSIQSKKDLFGLTLAYDAKAGGLIGNLRHNAIPIDRIASQLSSGGKPVIQGGTLKISLEGLFKSKSDGFWVDFPLQVGLQNTTLNIKGLAPTKVENLMLPLGLSGPLSSPRITLKEEALTDALLKAGKAELANQLKSRAGKLIDDKLGKKLNDKLGDKLGGKVADGTKQLAKDVLEGNGEAAAKKLVDDAKKKAEDEAKKKLEEEKQKAADELKKKADEGLKKLLPITSERKRTKN